MGQGHYKALQCIRGLPRTILTRIELIRTLDQSIDRRRVRRLPHLNCGNIVERNRLRRGGHHGLGIGGVATRGTHESILTDRAGVKEFLGARTAHRTRHRRNDDVFQAQALKDTLVGVALILVGNIQPGIVNIEGIRILHDKFAATDQTRARTRFIAILRLDLVDSQRKILVGGILILHQEGKHLLVGRGQ